MSKAFGKYIRKNDLSKLMKQAASQSREGLSKKAFFGMVKDLESKGMLPKNLEDLIIGPVLGIDLLPGSPERRLDSAFDNFGDVNPYFTNLTETMYPYFFEGKEPSRDEIRNKFFELRDGGSPTYKPKLNPTKPLPIEKPQPSEIPPPVSTVPVQETPLRPTQEPTVPTVQVDAPPVIKPTEPEQKPVVTKEDPKSEESDMLKDLENNINMLFKNVSDFIIKSIDSEKINEDGGFSINKKFIISLVEDQFQGFNEIESSTVVEELKETIMGILRSSIDNRPYSIDEEYSEKINSKILKLSEELFENFVSESLSDLQDVDLKILSDNILMLSEYIEQLSEEESSLAISYLEKVDVEEDSEEEIDFTLDVAEAELHGIVDDVYYDLLISESVFLKIRNELTYLEDKKNVLGLFNDIMNRIHSQCTMSLNLFKDKFPKSSNLFNLLIQIFESDLSYVEKKVNSKKGFAQVITILEELEQEFENRSNSSSITKYLNDIGGALTLSDDAESYYYFNKLAGIFYFSLYRSIPHSGNIVDEKEAKSIIDEEIDENLEEYQLEKVNINVFQSSEFLSDKTEFINLYKDFVSGEYKISDFNYINLTNKLSVAVSNISTNKKFDISTIEVGANKTKSAFKKHSSSVSLSGLISMAGKENLDNLSIEQIIEIKDLISDKINIEGVTSILSDITEESDKAKSFAALCFVMLFLDASTYPYNQERKDVVVEEKSEEEESEEIKSVEEESAEEESQEVKSVEEESEEVKSEEEQSEEEQSVEEESEEVKSVEEESEEVKSEEEQSEEVKSEEEQSEEKQSEEQSEDVVSQDLIVDKGQFDTNFENNSLEYAAMLYGEISEKIFNDISHNMQIGRRQVEPGTYIQDESISYGDKVIDISFGLSDGTDLLTPEDQAQTKLILLQSLDKFKEFKDSLNIFNENDKKYIDSFYDSLKSMVEAKDVAISENDKVSEVNKIVVEKIKELDLDSMIRDNIMSALYSIGNIEDVESRVKKINSELKELEKNSYNLGLVYLIVKNNIGSQIDISHNMVREKSTGIEKTITFEAGSQSYLDLLEDYTVLSGSRGTTSIDYNSLDLTSILEQMNLQNITNLDRNNNSFSLSENMIADARNLLEDAKPDPYQEVFERAGSAVISFIISDLGPRLEKYAVLKRVALGGSIDESRGVSYKDIANSVLEENINDISKSDLILIIKGVGKKATYNKDFYERLEESFGSDENSISKSSGSYLYNKFMFLEESFFLSDDFQNLIDVERNKISENQKVNFFKKREGETGISDDPEKNLSDAKRFFEDNFSKFFESPESFLEYFVGTRLSTVMNISDQDKKERKLEGGLTFLDNSLYTEFQFDNNFNLRTLSYFIREAIDQNIDTFAKEVGGFGRMYIKNTHSVKGSPHFDRYTIKCDGKESIEALNAYLKPRELQVNTEKESKRDRVESKDYYQIINSYVNSVENVFNGAIDSLSKKLEEEKSIYMAGKKFTSEEEKNKGLSKYFQDSGSKVISSELITLNEKVQSEINNTLRRSPDELKNVKSKDGKTFAKSFEDEIKDVIERIRRFLNSSVSSKDSNPYDINLESAKNPLSSSNVFKNNVLEYHLDGSAASLYKEYSSESFDEVIKNVNDFFKYMKNSVEKSIADSDKTIKRKEYITKLNEIPQITESDKKYFKKRLSKYSTNDDLLPDLPDLVSEDGKTHYFLPVFGKGFDNFSFLDKEKSVLITESEEERLANFLNVNELGSADVNQVKKLTLAKNIFDKFEKGNNLTFVDYTKEDHSIFQDTFYIVTLEYGDEEKEVYEEYRVDRSDLESALLVDKKSEEKIDLKPAEVEDEKKDVTVSEEDLKESKQDSEDTSEKQDSEDTSEKQDSEDTSEKQDSEDTSGEQDSEGVGQSEETVISSDTELNSFLQAVVEKLNSYDAKKAAILKLSNDILDQNLSKSEKSNLRKKLFNPRNEESNIYKISVTPYSAIYFEKQDAKIYTNIVVCLSDTFKKDKDPDGKDLTKEDLKNLMIDKMKSAPESMTNPLKAGVIEFDSLMSDFVSKLGELSEYGHLWGDTEGDGGFSRTLYLERMMREILRDSYPEHSEDLSKAFLEMAEKVPEGKKKSLNDYIENLKSFQYMNHKMGDILAEDLSEVDESRRSIRVIFEKNLTDSGVDIENILSEDLSEENFEFLKDSFKDAVDQHLLNSSEEPKEEQEPATIPLKKEEDEAAEESTNNTLNTKSENFVIENRLDDPSLPQSDLIESLSKKSDAEIVLLINQLDEIKTSNLSGYNALLREILKRVTENREKENISELSISGIRKNPYKVTDEFIEEKEDTCSIMGNVSGLKRPINLSKDKDILLKYISAGFKKIIKERKKTKSTIKYDVFKVFIHDMATLDEDQLKTRILNHFSDVPKPKALDELESLKSSFSNEEIFNASAFYVDTKFKVKSFVFDEDANKKLNLNEPRKESYSIDEIDSPAISYDLFMQQIDRAINAMKEEISAGDIAEYILSVSKDLSIDRASVSRKIAQFCYFQKDEILEVKNNYQHYVLDRINDFLPSSKLSDNEKENIRQRASYVMTEVVRYVRLNIKEEGEAEVVDSLTEVQVKLRDSIIENIKLAKEKLEREFKNSDINYLVYSSTNIKNQKKIEAFIKSETKTNLVKYVKDAIDESLKSFEGECNEECFTKTIYDILSKDMIGKLFGPESVDTVSPESANTGIVNLLKVCIIDVTEDSFYNKESEYITASIDSKSSYGVQKYFDINDTYFSLINHLISEVNSKFIKELISYLEKNGIAFLNEVMDNFEKMVDFNQLNTLIMNLKSVPKEAYYDNQIKSKNVLGSQRSDLGYIKSRWTQETKDKDSIKRLIIFSLTQHESSSGRITLNKKSNNSVFKENLYYKINEMKEAYSKNDDVLFRLESLKKNIMEEETLRFLQIKNVFDKYKNMILAGKTLEPKQMMDYIKASYMMMIYSSDFNESYFTFTKYNRLASGEIVKEEISDAIRLRNQTEALNIEAKRRNKAIKEGVNLNFLYKEIKTGLIEEGADFSKSSLLSSTDPKFGSDLANKLGFYFGEEKTKNKLGIPVSSTIEPISIGKIINIIMDLFNDKDGVSEFYKDLYNKVVLGSYTEGLNKVKDLLVYVSGKLSSREVPKIVMTSMDLQIEESNKFSVLIDSIPMIEGEVMSREFNSSDLTVIFTAKKIKINIGKSRGPAKSRMLFDKFSNISKEMIDEIIIKDQNGTLHSVDFDVDEGKKKNTITIRTARVREILGNIDKESIGNLDVNIKIKESRGSEKPNIIIYDEGKNIETQEDLKIIDVTREFFKINQEYYPSSENIEENAEELNNYIQSLSIPILKVTIKNRQNEILEILDSDYTSISDNYIIKYDEFGIQSASIVLPTTEEMKKASKATVKSIKLGPNFSDIKYFRKKEEELFSLETSLEISYEKMTSFAISYLKDKYDIPESSFTKTLSGLEGMVRSKFDDNVFEKYKEALSELKNLHFKNLEDIKKVSFGVLNSNQNDNKYLVLRKDIPESCFEYELIRDDKGGDRVKGGFYNDIKIEADYYRHIFITEGSSTPQRGLAGLFNSLSGSKDMETVDILVCDTKIEGIKQYNAYINSEAKHIIGMDLFGFSKEVLTDEAELEKFFSLISELKEEDTSHSKKVSMGMIRGFLRDIALDYVLSFNGFKSENIKAGPLVQKILEFPFDTNAGDKNNQTEAKLKDVVDNKGSLIRGSNTNRANRGKMIGPNGFLGMFDSMKAIINSCTDSKDSLLDSIGIIILSFFIGLNNSRKGRYSNAEGAFSQSILVSSKESNLREDYTPSIIDYEVAKEISDSFKKYSHSFSVQLKRPGISGDPEREMLAIERQFKREVVRELDIPYSTRVLKDFYEKNKDRKDVDIKVIEDGIEASKLLMSVYNTYISKPENKNSLDKMTDFNKKMDIDRLESFRDKLLSSLKKINMGKIKILDLQSEDGDDLLNEIIKNNKKIISSNLEFIEENNPVHIARIYQKLRNHYAATGDLTSDIKLKKRFFLPISIFVESIFKMSRSEAEIFFEDLESFSPDKTVEKKASRKKRALFLKEIFMGL